MLKINVGEEYTDVHIEGSTRTIVRDMISGIGSVYGAIRNDPVAAVMFRVMLRCAVNDDGFWEAAVQDAEDSEKEEVTE